MHRSVLPKIHEYEVEAILDSRIQDGQKVFKVKWKNWPASSNTWEPQGNLSNCQEILCNFEKQSALKNWEAQINFITKGHPFISIENSFDLTGPPESFSFINEYLPGDGVVIPNEPPMGCNCGKQTSACYFEGDSSCCPAQAGMKFSYTKFSKLQVLPGSPIYECNSKCQCGPNCGNRVVGDGRSGPNLTIFRTNDGRGWGVKPQKTIKKNTFVALYVGEVVKFEESVKRIKTEPNCAAYMYDLDFNAEKPPYTVDASKQGNVSHFINHSCDPNLGVFAVWNECLDPDLPLLAMFALKQVKRDEELTFDYKMAKIDDASGNEKIVCLCKAAKCRGFMN